MMTRSRAGAALFSLLLTIGCAPRAAVAPADSQVQRDPALRTGTLPNGMRYYVRENAMPAGRAFLWLAVNAGSVLESDDQRGYAHFLEHMAFNGTTSFPDQSLIDFIEGSGMEFGADLNASTSFDETVYKLTVPTDDTIYLARGLQVLHDWASGGITMDSVEVVKERGVVLGEWRSRALMDSVRQRLNDHIQGVLFDTTVYRRRTPIGTPESLRSAVPAPMQRFYEDWYRPDLMAVIAVGDFDAEQVEQEIRTRFGVIPRPEDAPARFETDVPADAAPVVDVIRDKVPPRIDILWRAPARPTDVRAALRQELVLTMLSQHLQRRFLEIREQSSRPFVDARLARQRIVRPLDVIAAEIVTWPDSLHAGLARVLGEVERAAQHGVPAAELEQLKAAVLRRAESEAAGAAARASSAFVADYTTHFLTGDGLLLSPAQRLELTRELLTGINARTLAQAAAFWREGAGMKILVRVPLLALGFEPPSRESILAIIDSIRHTRFAAHAPTSRPHDSPLETAAPARGSIINETVHAESGIFEWRLSNGARVLFKPSRNHPDELLVRAWSAGGMSRLSDRLFYSSGRMAGPIMTEAGGAGERDHNAIIDALATTTVRPLRVHIGYAEETMELGGSPAELETMLQLMHLQFTAPKLDSASIETWANVARYQNRPATIHDAFNQIFARGNPRMQPPSTHLAQLARPDEVLAVFHDRFGNAGDFTFLIAGAVTPEQVRPLVEQYIASLPATPEREEPKDPTVRPFRASAHQVQRAVPVPFAQTLVVFDDSFPTDPDEYFTEREKLDALAYVLRRRLRERLREELGGTYGVAVSASTYRLYGEHFRVMIMFQADPEQMYDLNRELRAVLTALREEGPTAEELLAAWRAGQRRLETALQRNDVWLERMELHNRLGLPLDRIVTPFSDGPLTPEAVREAAVRYLPENAFIQLTHLPRADASD